MDVVTKLSSSPSKRLSNLATVFMEVSISMGTAAARALPLHGHCHCTGVTAKPGLWTLVWTVDWTLWTGT
jgi:hypothetical protein